MDLSNWVFERFGREHYQPGLLRMRRALGETHTHLNKLKIVIIAGTNGKGETTLRLGNFLSGAKFASWTSPHVKSLTERFRNQDGPIAEGDLKILLEESYEKYQKEGFQLSFYEFLFFVFCRWAETQALDYLLLEVGLGGEFDAVNVFDADLVLLPSISRDHQEFLGNRYDGILKEKLGVLRSKSTLISFLELQYLNEQVERKVKTLGAQWVNLNSSNKRVDSFSVKNQMLAYAGFQCLQGKSADSLLQNFSVSYGTVENRGEIITRGADFHLYGSHNIDGLRKLIQFLQSDHYTFSRINFDSAIVSFSSRSSRDLVVMLRMLKNSGLPEIVVTSFVHPKACPREVLARLCHQEGLRFVEDISAIIHQKSSGRVLVSGSYYFLSFIRSCLGQ